MPSKSSSSVQDVQQNQDDENTRIKAAIVKKRLQHDPLFPDEVLEALESAARGHFKGKFDVLGCRDLAFWMRRQASVQFGVARLTSSQDLQLEKLASELVGSEGRDS